MNNVRPIRGSQLLPNNAREECIRVLKVYDWVVFPNQDRVDAVVPDACTAAIEEALANGDTLSVDVIVPSVSSFPLPPFPQPAPDPNRPSCRVLSLNRTTIPSPTTGLPIEGAIVRLLFTFTVTVVIFDETTGTELCRFDVPIRLDDDVFVCLPEQLDESNIVCSINSINASASGLIIDNIVEIDLCVCKEVQVEAEVKLEVLAKFCEPRLPLIQPTPPISCNCPPIVQFPEQCDFYPKRNCDCQGLLNFTTAYPVTVTINNNGTSTVDTGLISINTEICPQCNPDASFLSMSYTSSTNSAFNFTFQATKVNSPIEPCTITPASSTLNVNGLGTRTFTTVVQPVETLNFSLSLTETGPGLPDTFNLILSTTGGTDVFNTPTVPVPDESLVVTDCVRLPYPV